MLGDVVYDTLPRTSVKGATESPFGIIPREIQHPHPYAYVNIKYPVPVTWTLGVAYVARSAPDGYTLLANSLSDAQNLHFMPLPYDTVADFVRRTSH